MSYKYLIHFFSSSVDKIVEDFNSSPCLAERYKKSDNLTTFITQDLCISEDSELCDNTSIKTCSIPTTLHKQNYTELHENQLKPSKNDIKGSKIISQSAIERCDQTISKEDCSIICEVAGSEMQQISPPLRCTNKHVETIEKDLPQDPKSKFLSLIDHTYHRLCHENEPEQAELLNVDMFADAKIASPGSGYFARNNDSYNSHESVDNRIGLNISSITHETQDINAEPISTSEESSTSTSDIIEEYCDDETFELANLSVQNEDLQLHCHGQSDQLEPHHEEALKSTLDTNQQNINIRHSAIIRKSPPPEENQIYTTNYDIIAKETEKKICREVFDSARTNSTSLSNAAVIDDFHIVDNNATKPLCHNDLQYNCHCPIHVMQVEPQREESTNPSPTPRINDKNRSNTEISSPSKCRSESVSDQSTDTKINEKSKKDHLEDSFDSSVSDRSKLSDNHDTYKINVSDEFCRSDDSPEPANQSIPNREYNEKELEALSYLQSTHENIGKEKVHSKTSTDESIPNTLESLESIENRHIDDSLDKWNDREEIFVEPIRSSKDDLERQEHKNTQKKIPVLKLVRCTFEDIQAHIPTYSHFFHEFDKLVRKVSVNGITKLHTLGPRLKRLKIPKNFNKAIISETSNNVIYDNTAIKRTPIRPFPKKEGRKKISKSVLLNKEFAYKVIKFNCVPHKSPLTSLTSASEKCKNSSKVPEYYPKLKKKVQTVYKMPKEKLINKTIIGLKRSKKKKNKSSRTKHFKSDTKQSSAFKQRSSPSTLSTSPSRKSLRSSKENYYPDTISNFIEIATYTPNKNPENQIFQGMEKFDEIVLDPRQEICKISRVESLATFDSENLASENSKQSNNDVFKDKNYTDQRIVKHSEVQPSINDVEMKGAVISNLMNTVYIPIKDTNILRTHIHDPDIECLNNSPPHIKEEDEPFLLELEFSQSP